MLPVESVNRARRRTADFRGIYRTSRDFPWLFWTLGIATLPWLLGPAIAAAEAASVPAGAANWRDAAEKDLKAVHRLLSENAAFTTPAVEGREMRLWLEAGFRKATAKLETVYDESTYQSLLSSYVSGFREPHLAVIFARPRLALPASWPGFSLRWRNHYEVAYVGDALLGRAPPIGSRLLGCDNQSENELATALLGQEGNPADPGLRFRTAPTLLWPKPFATSPLTCAFLMGGERRLIQLETLELGAEERESALSIGSYSPRARFGLFTWGDAWLIGIPDFNSREDWADLLESIGTNVDAIRQSPLIIIDVRGNSGGNTYYGDSLLRVLWNEDVASPLPGEQLIQMRVGPVVGDWIRLKAPQFSAAYDAALRQHQQTITVAPPANSLPSPRIRQVPVGGDVILLTDHSCASSCLNFVDKLLRAPKVRHFGLPTGADSPFGELAGSTLPSGVAQLILPIKYWPNRRRKAFEAYTPPGEATWPGVPNSAQGFLEWLRRALAASERRMSLPPPAEIRPVLSKKPKVVATYPASGEVIAPGPYLLKVTFNQPMLSDSFALATSERGLAPRCEGTPSLSSDATTFTWKCEAHPNRGYELWFNRGRYQGFRSKLRSEPATPYHLQFRTAPKEG